VSRSMTPPAKRQRLPNKASKWAPRRGAVFPAVNESLRRWGRLRWANWTAFEPLVNVRLSIVETEAVRLVEEEHLPRDVTEEDRQRAAWSIVKRAIECLRPIELDSRLQEALGALPVGGWPEGLPVPWELQQYLVLAGEYVWRCHVADLAEWLSVHQRTVANIRLGAVRSVSVRIAAWERSKKSSL
jgi:hypothetical protein